MARGVRISSAGCQKWRSNVISRRPDGFHSHVAFSGCFLKSILMQDEVSGTQFVAMFQLNESLYQAGVDA